MWAVAEIYQLIGSHWFQPWYATWAITLAALIPSRRVAGYTVIFSFFMLLHPIVLQCEASRLKLPPGGFHALMAAATLLVLQILAVRLAVRWQRGEPLAASS